MSTTPHLDDELLSAHLDGEAPEAAGHLDACAECRMRLDALQVAARLVGLPPPTPPTAVIDAAVGRALEGGRRDTRRPVLVALAAAAVLVLGVVGVGVLDDDGPSGTDTAALSDESGEVVAGGTGGAASAITDGGDLGDVGDAKALADTVRAVVEPPPTTTTADGAVADQGSAMASEAAPTARMAPLRSGGQAVGGGSTKDPYCEDTVGKTYGEGLGALVYRATLRWEGTPAVAVAYTLRKPKGELDHRIYVLAADGCRLLVAQTV